MEAESCVPPGFRFHPTEEELVGYYLSRKVACLKIDFEVITDVDLYRIEPWDLQDRCKLGYEEQNEWYFFSHKDKKHPTGTRTNRATTAGFWKATGRDKAVLSKSRVIGRRKTLVFYVGRAPNGRRTDWIMHEYRLQSSERETPQEEGWVVCRAFRKQGPCQRPSLTTYNPNPNLNPNHYNRDHHLQFASQPSADLTRSSISQFMEISNCYGNNLYEHPLTQNDHVFEIPRLDSPSLSTSTVASKDCFGSCVVGTEEFSGRRSEFVDWNVLDKLLASQMSESASCSSGL